METKTNEKGRFSAVQYPGMSKRGYYFHADEDFREDWDWKKDQPSEFESIGKERSSENLVV